MSGLAQIELLRIAEDEHSTFGVLMGDMDRRIPICLTVENSWKDNAPFLSCIPSGTYICKKRASARTRGDTYEILDVPGKRKFCIFHMGNTHYDTEGCVLPVSSFESVWVGAKRIIEGFKKDGTPSYKEVLVNMNVPGGFDSMKAFLKFMKYLNHAEKFELTITNLGLLAQIPEGKVNAGSRPDKSK